MRTVIFTFCTSFALSLILTPLARRIATRLGLVDVPDSRRKLHARPVPVAGGVAILISGILALGVVLCLHHPLSQQLQEQGLNLIGLLVAALVICAVGVADDFGWMRGRHKLLGQLFAVSILMAFGVLVRNISIFEWHLELGLLALPFTALFLLGAINSLNLLDGMDGLLGTVGLIVSLAMAVMAAMNDRWESAWVALALAGGILGFLRYNYPPASIFLGDSGSMLIGLVIGVLAITSSLKAVATASLAAPVALLTIPFFDTFAAILRRKLTGRSIYTTDLGHLHHVLQRRGLTTYGTLAVVAILCLVTVAASLGSLLLRNELFALLGAIAVMVIMVVTGLFGHAEMSLLHQRVRSFARSFLRSRPQAEPHHSEVRLQGSVDWSELWSEIIEYGKQLNLSMARLDVNAPAINEGYHARWNRDHQETEDAVVWHTEIPLVCQGRTVGRLEIIGRRDDEPVWQRIALLAKLVQEIEARVALLTQDAWNAILPEKKPAVLVHSERIEIN